LALFLVGAGVASYHSLAWGACRACDLRSRQHVTVTGGDLWEKLGK
jgi:hypothetical protein